MMEIIFLRSTLGTFGDIHKVFYKIGNMLKKELICIYLMNIIAFYAEDIYNLQFLGAK